MRILKVTFFLLCFPLYGFAQTTLFSYNFGTSFNSNLTATTYWCEANPNGNTSTGCISYGWASYAGTSGQHITTKAITLLSGTSTLSFNYKFNGTFSFPSVSISTTGCTTGFSTIATLANNSTCVSSVIDLSGYHDQTIYLKFASNTSSSTYIFTIDDILVTSSDGSVIVTPDPFWVTSITGSGYSGTLNSASPGANSTVYACYGSGLTLNSNAVSEIISGGVTYSRKWQTSSDGTNWFTTSLFGAGYATDQWTSQYYRVCYRATNLSFLSYSPWVHVIVGPSSVADPTNVFTTNITANSFTANWTSSSTVCPGGGLGIIHRINVSTVPTFASSITGYPVDVPGCFTNGATPCSYNVTGLTTGAIYYWQVRAMSYHHSLNSGDLYCGVNSNYIPTSTTLPINLVSFNADFNGKDIIVNWSTATEINNNYYTLERSSDIKKWNKIAEIPGAGNSNQVLNYSFVDTDPLLGTSYYRLKQTDFDGKFEYFGPVSVSCDGIFVNSGITIFPNPAEEKVSIQSENTDLATVYLSDITGRTISEYYKSNLSIPFEISLEDITPGIYLIRVVSEGFTKNYKIIRK